MREPRSWVDSQSSQNSDTQGSWGAVSHSRIPTSTLGSEHPDYKHLAHWSASSWTSCFLSHFREFSIKHFHLRAGVQDPRTTSSDSLSPTRIYCSNKELAVGSYSRRPGCPGPEISSLHCSRWTQNSHHHYLPHQCWEPVAAGRGPVESWQEEMGHNFICMSEDTSITQVHSVASHCPSSLWAWTTWPSQQTRCMLLHPRTHTHNAPGDRPPCLTHSNSLAWTKSLWASPASAWSRGSSEQSSRMQDMFLAPRAFFNS